MLFEDKTQNNIILELKAAVRTGTNTGEGTLIDHSFRGAAAEFERAYIGLGLIEQNGFAETADREHLILRAKERGMEPLPASNAIWKAEFNIDIKLNVRFSAAELTYICTQRIEAGKYRLMCEQTGTRGNTKRGELTPIEYIEGFETGELTELLVPARDDEDTEVFRARYISTVTTAQAFGGNRAQYKQAMHEMAGVGACKIYRATKENRRIQIYFLDSLYKTPSDSLVKEVQEIMDPIECHGEGEGRADIFHIVDIYPCRQDMIEVDASVILDSGYSWEDILPEVQKKLDEYYMELAKSWENSDYITVRILKINAAIADIEGVLDVQGTKINGKEENLVLDANAIPVRGQMICRK